MADPPRQRLPASFQRHGADSDTRFEQEKVSGGSEARSSEFQSGSEFVSASESKDSDQSLSASELDDDDLLDTDEEYERELVEQRLADEKNGHFAEGRSSSPARATGQSLTAPPPRVSMASHKARVSSKAMYLDEIVTAGGGEENREISENLSKIETSSLKSLNGGERFDLAKLNSAENNARIMAEIGGDYYNAKLQKIREFQMEILQEEIQKAPLNVGSIGHGKIDSQDMEIAENNGEGSSKFVLECSADLHGEENLNLDLLETRPLAKQIGSGHGSAADSGLPSSSLVSNSLNHVQPVSSNPSEPTLLKHSQPNFKTPLLSNLPISDTPSPITTQFNSQPTKKTHTYPSQPTPKPNLPKPRSKPPLPNKKGPIKNSITSYQPKNNRPILKPKFTTQIQKNKNSQLSSKFNHSAAGKELAVALFAGSKQPHMTPAAPAAITTNADNLASSNLQAFPPISCSTAAPKTGAGAASSSAATLQAATIQSHQSVTPATEPSATPPTSWADMMDEEMVSEEGAAGKNAKADLPEKQQNIHFGRSMAEILKSGQMKEGHILLDREKADKCGEIRIVEGKPCLFFSANETSILAGRLGPAIVGKFSHSIPPAHQIQKALGNLKLVGAMTWNFLNAKHIFIQLSDMRDYVKMLNGPNNSPVWYVEHHPMRVFKWTPDFDPFFESPIVTLWCSILALPVHLFEESSLIAIGEMLGKPVQVDHATISRTRVSFARICVEVDLTRPIPDEIDISIAGRHMTLKVKWDKIPLYCNECKHVGHSAMSCYASGKRPMPPKKDYSFGPSSQTRPTPNREGESRPLDESLAARFAAGRQPEVPQRQPNARQATGRPPTEANQPTRQEGRNKGKESSETPTGSIFIPGYTSAVAEGSHAAEDDGFVAPKKRNKSKSAARRERERERRREKSREITSSMRTISDGEGQHGAKADKSSTESERGSRSLSPTLRLGCGIGPLAMVVHENNMFGALQDPYSDEDAPDVDEPQDSTMTDVFPRKIHFTEPVVQLIGYTSPPAEGSQKRARLSASGAH